VLGHFLWRVPYFERVQGVLEGVPRPQGPLGAPSVSSPAEHEARPLELRRAHGRGRGGAVHRLQRRADARRRGGDRALGPLAVCERDEPGVGRLALGLGFGRIYCRFIIIRNLDEPNMLAK
jgi:hypothetical protein